MTLNYWIWMAMRRPERGEELGFFSEGRCKGERIFPLPNCGSTMGRPAHWSLKDASARAVFLGRCKQDGKPDRLEMQNRPRLRRRSPRWSNPRPETSIPSHVWRPPQIAGPRHEMKTRTSSDMDMYVSSELHATGFAQRCCPCCHAVRSLALTDSVKTTKTEHTRYAPATTQR